MNKFIIVWILSGAITTGFTQLLPNRYNEQVFASFTETSEVLFSTAVPTPEPGGGFYEFVTGFPLNVNEYETFNQNLYMDIFEPSGDTIEKRPLVIICFGGGFLTGNKDHWSIRKIAIQLAHRGYVTATIDYRLGMNIFDQDLSKRGPYRGLQDSRSAVRFFKADAANANNFKIDTSKIFVGGHSAGAFIALHNAYLDKESERPLSTYNWVQDGNAVPDQLCLDCVGDNTSFSGHANAIFSLAGALGDTLYIDSANDNKVTMFHSSDDTTVPIDSGTPFGSSLTLVIGDDLPVVYGSESIDIRANNLGLNHIFNTYTDRGHDVHEETSVALYNDIIPKISDSFFVHLLRPIEHQISGDSIVCNDQSSSTYSTIVEQAKYYDWQVIGGNIVELDNMSPLVTVQWDPNVALHNLYLTPYSCTGARGYTDSLEIQLLDVITNTWMGQNGSWISTMDWNQGHIPTICEDVVYPDQTNIIDVHIPQNTAAYIHSLLIGNKVSFTTQSNVVLDINGGD